MTVGQIQVSQSSIQYRVNTWKDLLAAGDATQEYSSPFPLAIHQLSAPMAAPSYKIPQHREHSRQVRYQHFWCSHSDHGQWVSCSKPGVSEVYWCFPGLLLPSLLLSIALMFLLSSSRRTERETGLLYLQHQTSTELIFPWAYVWVEFRKQHLRDCFVFSEDSRISIRTLVRDHNSIFILRWRIFQIHLFSTNFWIMQSCIQY